MAKTLKIVDKPNDPRAKYDWQKIRREYIEGVDDGTNTGTIVFPTFSELSKKYDAPVEQIMNKSAKEHWSQVKKAEMNRVSFERQKMLAKTLAKKQIKFSERAAEDAMQSQIALGKRIKQMSEIVEVDNIRIAGMMERVEQGEEITEAFRKELRSLVSPNEWESLWKAYALANEVGRKALGMKDEEGPQTTIEINQINNNPPSEVLKESDRNKQLLQVLQNPNLVIPGFTVDAPELESTVDAEVVEDDE